MSDRSACNEAECDKTVYIGCGAGFAGDRFDAATPVVETLATCDGPRYLMFEVLAERTLAIAQRVRREDPTKGYSPFLDEYVTPVLGACKQHGIRIVSNFGAANPRGAARRVLEIAREQGIADLKVAVVEGDDLTDVMSDEQIRTLPTIEGLDAGGRELVAANAYLGARPIAQALALGADVVAVGRTTDAALALGPLIHEFGWAQDDWDRLAAGTVAGHLLECGAQVTGAYFADPGFKDVDDLWRVGFPIAEVQADGTTEITKARHTGGLVSPRTVKEQLLYEIHDPGNYLTPDVVLDMSGIEVEEVAEHRVRLTGTKGKPRPETLKATLSFDGGWLGEAEITYAGPNARRRAELAVDVIRNRCRSLGLNTPVRFDILGTLAVLDDDSGSLRASAAKHTNEPADGEFRVRAATRSLDRKAAERLSNEVLSLYCSGPAGGAGVRQSVTPQIQTTSVLVDRELIQPRAELVAE